MPTFEEKKNKKLFIALIFSALTIGATSCKKEEEEMKKDDIVNAKAEKNTIVIDGVKTKLTAGMAAPEPSFNKSFMHIAQASTPIIRLDMYFSEKPVSGTYPVTTERYDFSNPIKGKCHISIPTSFMSSGTSKSTGEVKITANGNDITVVINDAVLVDMQGVSRTVSVYYTNIGATAGGGGGFIFN